MSCDLEKITKLQTWKKHQISKLTKKIVESHNSF